VAGFLLREWIIQNTQPEDNLLNEDLDLEADNELVLQQENNNDQENNDDDDDDNDNVT